MSSNKAAVVKRNPEIMIAGIGTIPTGEIWGRSLRDLAAEAARVAMQDSGGIVPQAIYIGNALANVLSHQANLGALIAESCGLYGAEAFTIEADGASGACALRMATMAVRSGLVDSALALGVEKFSDCDGVTAASAYNLTLNYEFESSDGLTTSARQALLAQLYLNRNQLTADIFHPLVHKAFQSGKSNPHALYQNGLSMDKIQNQPHKTPPLGLYDFAAFADGVAAILVTRAECVAPEKLTQAVTIASSASASAPLSLHDRIDLLDYHAARFSAGQALTKAGLTLAEIDYFELWDASTIDLILSLEALGLCEHGQGWKNIPDNVNLSGGRLSCGNPLGASGLYQIADTVRALRNRTTKTALVQSLAGAACTAVTHILCVKN